MAKKLYSNSEEINRPLSESKEVKRWHERIGLAKKANDAWADESGAKRFVREYKGKFDIFFNGLKGRIPVPPINEVFAYVQSDIASTYNRDPYITVNPKAGTVKGAKLWEVIINYTWRELKTKEELELEIIDKDLVGFAWHKVGYAVNSMGSGEQLKIESEKLYSNRVDWKDVFWNINSKRPPEDCEWMAQRIVRPLEDIKKQYPAANSMEGTPNPNVDSDAFKKLGYKDDIKVGVIYEIWDARKKQICLIAEGIDDGYLEAPKPWPDYLDEFPFLMYWDFAIPGEPRPLSAIAPWEAQILEEMVILAQAINHAKRWNRQLFVKGGSIDENSLDKFERGDDGAVITVNGNMDEASFRFADFGQLPTDFYLIMGRLQAIKRNTHGQPEFARGGVTKTGTRTVGELNLMEQGAKGRDERKIDRLETHLENIARHKMAHLKANFDFEEAIKVTGDAPEELVEALGQNFDPLTRRVKFTPEEIKGEYDIEVKAGSTLPLNKQNRTQMLETILTTVAQVQGPMTNFMSTLIGEILDDYEMKSLELAFKADMQQAQAQQQEAQQHRAVESGKVEAETAKRSAQAQDIGLKTQLAIHEAETKQPEQQKVSESISFKDLPPEGRVQMAAQAGIHLPMQAAIKLPPQPPIKNGAAKK